MASLMNLALVAGNLGTKYLNLVFPVDRGDYANLPTLSGRSDRDQFVPCRSAQSSCLAGGSADPAREHVASAPQTGLSRSSSIDGDDCLP